MKQVIHNIRNKPDHHKNRIIIISAAIAVGVLLLIWAAVGNGHRGQTDENFFQTFNEEVKQNKDTLPAQP